MNTQYLEKIISFNNDLFQYNLQSSNDENFMESLLKLLNTHFNVNNTCMTSLSNTGKKELSFNFKTNHIDYSFLQKLIAYYQKHPEYFLNHDFFWLNQDERQDRSFYKEILKPFGYQDFIIQFIKVQKSSKYLSCILYVSKNNFKKDFVEALHKIESTIALVHLENINNNRLTSRIQKLTDTMNFYPTGILYLSNKHQIIHANNIAKEYLKAFNINDPMLYDTFFMDHLYSYYMRVLRNKETLLPLRIQDYLFSIVKINEIEELCPAYKIFEEELDQTHPLDKSIDEAIACIYIIYSKQNEIQFSSTYLLQLGLTPREIEITEYVTKGLSNIEIAQAMHISENTVKTHLSNIYKKLNINYRTELITYMQNNTQPL